jgi:acetyl esterase/lipase
MRSVQSKSLSIAYNFVEKNVSIIVIINILINFYTRQIFSMRLFLKIVLRGAAAVLMAASLLACSPAVLLNSLVPTEEMTATRNIAYGALNRQQLDVYTPSATQARSAKRPVIVFFYGGSWDSGSKDAYLFVAEALTSKGFIAVIPDYRVYPEVIYPEFLNDGAKAFQWTKDNIEKYGGDVNNIFVAGHSAGAHIAAMLAFDSTWLNTQKLSTTNIRGFIGLAGPYDFLPLTSARLKEIFPSAEIQASSQPIRYARGNAPPALLLAGDADTVVATKNTKNFSERIRESKGRIQEKYYAGMGHVKIVTVLAAPFRNGHTVLEDIAEFVRAESRSTSSLAGTLTSAGVGR